MRKTFLSAACLGLAVFSAACSNRSADIFDSPPHIAIEADSRGTPLAKPCSQRADKNQLSGKVEVTVSYLADGDTFTACTTDGSNLQVKVRLFGVDCPETHYNDKCRRDGEAGRQTCEEQIPLGQNAMRRAIELIKGQNVALEPSKANNGYKEDGYDRILAYVRLENQEDFGKKLIEEGLCDDFSWRYRHPRMEDYRAAQSNRGR